MGNIPFSISSPLIDVLVNEYEHIREAVLMFQKEFADRLLAQPGSTSYGKLSVITELHFERNFGFNVKRTMFHPPPQVDASVVKLIPRKQFPIPVQQNEMNTFKEFLVCCFAYKRKTLINSLHASCARMKLNADKNVLMKIIKELNLTSNIRAEQMNLEQFWHFFLALPHARNDSESR
jgi:16S rRNA (adenine1518-N6/adenine1519-N6)-dimethyltransferase